MKQFFNSAIDQSIYDAIAFACIIIIFLVIWGFIHYCLKYQESKEIIKKRDETIKGDLIWREAADKTIKDLKGKLAANGILLDMSMDSLLGFAVESEKSGIENCWAKEKCRSCREDTVEIITNLRSENRELHASFDDAITEIKKLVQEGKEQRERIHKLTCQIQHKKYIKQIDFDSYTKFKSVTDKYPQFFPKGQTFSKANLKTNLEHLFFLKSEKGVPFLVNKADFKTI